MADGAQVLPLGRVPPNELDAEGAILAAILCEETTEPLDEARSLLTPGDFYANANATIFEAVCTLDAEGKPTDVVSVASWLRDRGRLAQIGGTPYLATLAGGVPSVAQVRAHAELVAEKARQRRVVTFAQKIAAEGYGRVEDPRAWALDAAQGLSDIATEGGEHSPAETMSELMPRVIEGVSARKRGEGVSRGVDTGWKDLTALLGGWARGKMHVVAGRPGMGKSSFVLGAVINVAKQGEPASLFSAEMTKEELVERALAVVADVNVQKISRGELSAKEWAAVTAASSLLAKLPITLKYVPGAKIAEVRAFFRSEQRRHGRKLGLGVVDYMQVLDGERRDGDSRESEVANISKRLMWMAGEFDIPILAVSQLNRAVEARANTNKRPSLGDLRESGAIEQDAFTVTLLYRDDYYNKGSEQAGTIEAIVAKHRNGPTSTVKLMFTADSTRVDDIDGGQERLPGYDPHDPRWQ